MPENVRSQTSVVGVMRFCLPYLKPYVPLFICGIILAILFGASNGGAVYAITLMAERLAPKEAIVESAEKPERVKFVEQINEQISVWADDYLPGREVALNTQRCVGVIVFIGGLTFIRGACGFASSMILSWVMQHVVRDIRAKIVAHLNSLSMDSINAATRGEMMTRLNDDTRVLRATLDTNLVGAIKHPATLISVVGVLFFINVPLTIIALVFMPLAFLPLAILSKKARKATHGVRKAKSKQSSTFLELLANQRIVKAYGLEQLQADEFAVQANKQVRHTMKRQRSRELTNPIIESVGSVALAIIIIYVFIAGLEIQDLAGFLTAVFISFSPIKSLAHLHIKLAEGAVSVDRLKFFFGQQSKVVEATDPQPLRSCRREIEIRQVSFQYETIPVLREISLTIPFGSRLGIVGESGSGKSTLINLLFRLYDPTSGSILIDGQDIRDISLADLRSRMAIVTQDTFLFNRTIYENIALGREGASHEEIEQAAKMAHAHDFILRLENGYETLPGESGAFLSGGQKQRIALARAFVRDAPILVLDEPTAALDSESEEEVNQGLQQLQANRTVIMIAHRLSTLRECDQIITLEQGRISQQGTYDELIAVDGLFTRLAILQGINR
jgi:subfamily B ATP-binding cassette protein MsbA